MLPTAIVSLQGFPLNHRGKVDRAALPAPEHWSAPAGQTGGVPRNLLELQLVQIWERVLEDCPGGRHR